MIRIKKLKEHDVVEDFLEKEFHWLVDPRYETNMDDINFLKSLNLTREQYTRLAKMIDNYAMEKYSEGSNGF